MQSITVLELLIRVHGWQGGTIWQAFRELKQEHKQIIKDLAFLHKINHNNFRKNILHKFCDCIIVINR